MKREKKKQKSTVLVSILRYSEFASQPAVTIIDAHARSRTIARPPRIIPCAKWDPSLVTPPTLSVTTHCCPRIMHVVVVVVVVCTYTSVRRKSRPNTQGGRKARSTTDRERTKTPPTGDFPPDRHLQRAGFLRFSYRYFVYTTILLS